MSSDLLAEFDSYYRAPQNGTPNNISAPSPSQPTSAFEDLSFLGTLAPSQNKSESQLHWSEPVSKQSEDIWATLETTHGGEPQLAANVSATDPWQSFQLGHTGGAGKQMPLSTNTQFEGNSPNPRIIRRPTIDLFSSKIANVTEPSPTRQMITQNPNAKTRTLENKNVLFDAANELDAGGDDEFGEFETVTSPDLQTDHGEIGSFIKARETMKMPNDLLKTEANLQTSSFPYPQAPRSPSFRERNPFADLILTTPPGLITEKDNGLNTESPVTAWPEYEAHIPPTGPYSDLPALNDHDVEEEDWGDFEDLPTETKKQKSQKAGVEVDSWVWDAVGSQPAIIPAASADVPPPTNIPPPSVLLAVFHQLFNLPQSSLFQTVSTQPFALKNRILSDPSTIDFLRAYVLLATVAARIISGRKLRWKRDTHLSQAMKIGPAAAHGKGGMKLTGVDKAEVTREEREAADLVRIWRDQVGRLRSAVAAANSSLHDQSAHLDVPEISETMTVKAEGALTGPKACFLCGLKREERISKVDFQVEDSFGEWWVEHWGHRACRNFWQEHESKLKQR